MVNNVEPWLIGQLGKIGLSIATAVVSFCLGRLWLDVLRPWIQSFWWSGVELESSYKGEFVKVGTAVVLHDHIELQQKANRVWGTMTVADGRYGKYEFKATLCNGVLRGTYESVGKATTTSGSFLLATQSGSSELKGWSIEPIDGVVIAYEYKWCVRTR